MVKNLDKKLFYFSLIFVVVIAFFSFGMYSAVKRNGLYKSIMSTINEMELVWREQKGNLIDEPIYFMQPPFHKGAGVVKNDTNDDNLIFLVGYFGESTGIRLIERNGTIVREWPILFSKLISDPSYLRFPPNSDRNIDLHGALMNPDGSIVFNFEYGGTVKLSRCGDVDWTLPETTHHSIDRAEGGGYWIPGRYFITAESGKQAPPYTDYYKTAVDDAKSLAFEDDYILKVDENGKVVKRKAVYDLFIENDLEGLLTSQFVAYAKLNEIVHLNKIAELPSAYADKFPGFEAGDLLLSFRTHNLLMVVDPDDWRVKWYHTGPYKRQHDPEFDPDGTISVYNNNTYVYGLGEIDRPKPDTKRVSDILKINPSNNEVTRVYGNVPGEEFLSVIRGKHDLTPNGGVMINEFEAGRAFEINSDGQVIWDFINRYNDDWVLEMTEARVYPRSYFTVNDWSCENDGD